MDENCKVEAKVEELLDEFGILYSLKAYKYIARAVALYMENPTPRIQDKIFHMIGREFNVERESVRKAISRAVRFCWKCYPVEKLEKVFGEKFSTGEQPPTCNEFIAMCAKWTTTNL